MARFAPEAVALLEADAATERAEDVAGASITRLADAIINVRDRVCTCGRGI